MTDDTLIDLAMRTAIKAHAGQFRRDGKTHYIAHPRDVAERIREAGYGPIHQAIAWLHDVVEDTSVTLEDLDRLGFPSRVVCGVRDITKTKGEEYNDYLAKVRLNGYSRNVKVYDILSNLADKPTLGQAERYASALLFLLP